LLVGNGDGVSASSVQRGEGNLTVSGSGSRSGRSRARSRSLNANLSTVNAGFSGSALNTIAVAIGEDVNLNGRERWLDELDILNNLVDITSSRKSEDDLVDVSQVAVSGESRDREVVGGKVDIVSQSVRGERGSAGIAARVSQSENEAGWEIVVETDSEGSSRLDVQVEVVTRSTIGQRRTSLAASGISRWIRQIVSSGTSIDNGSRLLSNNA